MRNDKLSCPPEAGLNGASTEPVSPHPAVAEAVSLTPEGALRFRPRYRSFPLLIADRRKRTDVARLT
jgi:hypothetical protein